MPYRQAVAKEMANMCKLISHPDRIRILVELQAGPKNVNSLAEMLNITSSRVSQHLALLRAHRHVIEQRSGRRHVYRLTQPNFAKWILGSLELLQNRNDGVSHIAIQSVRKLWCAPGD